MEQNIIRHYLHTCFKTYELYSNILNSYVSDYYLENHWNKLNTSWQKYLDNIDINKISNLLDFAKPLDKSLCPLSILCIRKIITTHTLSRKMIKSGNILSNSANKFMNLFWKNVKLKKRHEIEILSKLSYDSAQKTNCFYIVDIGSGLGHLSRMLSYGYGLKVCTFEAVEELVKLAKEMDTNFENALNKKNIAHKSNFKTVHINAKITQELIERKFLELVMNAFNSDNTLKFGIVGLHPCGDLGALLLKLFKKCSNIVFINIASCCYMKITLNPVNEAKFPLSSFCKNREISLSYLACEIACHAIENYSEKLKNKEEYDKLKIHAYRAALEDILVAADPKLKHSMIGGAKCDKNLCFEKYVVKVCDKFHILPNDKILLYENVITNTWQRVVAFYSIRLLLAPLVENIILLDRLLYISESGNYCKMIPAFDCKISPRNQVLNAFKIKN